MTEDVRLPVLHPPHGLYELTLPEDPDLRKFFEKCIETPDFQRAGSEREQVQLTKRWADEHLEGRVSYQALADFFQVYKSTIHHHLTRPIRATESVSPCRNGRPPILNEHQAKALAEFIVDRFNKRYPVSYEDCREFIMSEFEIAVNIISLRSFLSRMPIFKTVTGIPMEDSRNFCDESEIDSYLQQLEDVLRVGQVPAAFIMNIDEAGFAEYVDTHNSVRIVPASYAQKTVPVPVSRAEKRASLLAGICADGDTLKPMIVVPRDTMERELILRGYTVDKIHFAHSEKGYMTTDLFLQWAEKSFFPEIRRKRAFHDYYGPAILILDQYGSHCSDTFVSMCEDENVVCMFIPAHTSDQLQPCDLGVFAIQKRWSANIQISEDLNRQTKQIVKIIDSFRMATTFKNVTAAFRRAGIVTFIDESSGRLMARFDIRYASAVRHLELDDEDTLHLPGDKSRIRIN